MKAPPALTIDVGAVTSRRALHALLAKELGFPAYYGHNWDAFDECIRDYPPRGTIRIVGVERLSASLPREAKLLKSCFESFVAEMPGRRSVIFKG